MKHASRRKAFERHSRVGMVDEESFAQRVTELRSAGAKYVFLKTGAYRPADLARALLYVSRYKLDLLTVDGRLTSPDRVYRKVVPSTGAASASESIEVYWDDEGVPDEATIPLSD